MTRSLQLLLMVMGLALAGAGCSANDVGSPTADMAMASACPAPSIICGALCVDPQSDPRNCGACGSACTAGSACQNGHCALTCAAGRTGCPKDGVCTDLTVDPLHCGDCGTACAPGQLCDQGVCGQACPMGLLHCGSACVDLQGDKTHCGNCAASCAAGSLCNGGACKLSCQSGLVDCGGACVDLQSDESHCGDCATVCIAGMSCMAGACALVCPTGLTACDNGMGPVCTNLMGDAGHCGDCNTRCAPGNVCAAGACALSCQMGFAQCGGDCADLQSDVAHCGDCLTACAGGERCVAGVCTLVCATGLTACNGAAGLGCVDLQSDRSHCGDCATSCGPGSSCAAGQCVISCAAPLIACQSNTVCQDPRIDPQNCGACGTVCGANNTIAACIAGACSALCQVGYADCNGNAADGCEVQLSSDAANCGHCGNACPNGVACTGGLCGMPMGESVLVVHAMKGMPPTFAADVQSHLMGTGAFLKVDLFDASVATPSLAQLAAYTAVLAFSDPSGFSNGTQLGDTLAAYFDGGGRVVLAGEAFDPLAGVGGTFASGGYALATGPGFSPLSGVLQILDPMSPLVTGVMTLSANASFVSTLTLVPGTMVAAQWSTLQPLAIHGVVKGRNRADLNLFPLSNMLNPGYWAGDGATLMKNALLYR
jgi:hypothetical protein